jgi:predicted ATPase
MPQGERGFSQFVGRTRELATLRVLLAAVEDGRGQVVGVVGEPGMGKSRLVYEFRCSVPESSLAYLAGRCFSYGSNTPYLPILDLLRYHCGLTDADTPQSISAKIRQSLQAVGMPPDEWAPLLLQLLGVQMDTGQLAALSPEALKARTFATLMQMCINYSQQQPLVLEIENLHWIDATSEEFLTTLVERVAGLPILVLVTYRPGYRPAWIDKSYVAQIALQRLAPHDSRQVIQSVLQTTVIPESLVQQFLLKADGNPFFLEELAWTVREHGDSHALSVVPNTIQAVLAARIDRLPPTAKRLLQMAAVLGKEVRWSLLQVIAGLPENELGNGLRHLQATEFLYETHLFPDVIYTFKHVLTQEVAYQSLLKGTRQQYHRQVAQVLLERCPEHAETHPELLAHHYTEGGLSAQAMRYW